MEQTLRPQEELAFIRKLMADSRGQVADDGKPSIIWGIIVALGMLYNYYEVTAATTKYAGWVWIALSALGCIYIVAYLRTQRRTERVRTFAGRVAGAIWGAVGISLALIIAGTILGYAFERNVELNPIFICAMTSIILGIGYYLSSILYEIPWLRWVAFGWWASSLTYIFWPSVYSMLIYALAMIVLQIIPGIMLLRRYKRNVA